ncbi:hypothetical protein HK101_005803, partial [Irineochytrium annulatum]
MPFPEFDDFYDLKVKPLYTARFVPGVFAKWSLAFSFQYSPTPSIIESYMLCKLNIPIDTLTVTLEDMKPTPDSILFVLDDQGFLLVSTENGTVGVNATLRQTAPGNTNPVIAAAGSTLASKYGHGSITALPNDTGVETITVGSQSWLVGSKVVVMPVSGQLFQLVLLVPRADYYGKLEYASLKSLIIACGTAVVGICVAILFGYLSSQPLRILARNMHQLAKFDFSVLDAGRLESTSMVQEINEVESTFWIMVRAFAESLKRRRQSVHPTRDQGGSSKGPSPSKASGYGADQISIMRTGA